MKNLTKKILFTLLTAALLLGVSGIAASADAAPSMTITLRVEGTGANLFYKTEAVPYTDSLTLQQALLYIDQQESGLTITGLNSGYIASVNGENAGKFGGWDGWNYSVNGIVPSVGIDSCALKDGDSVVLFYGDPYGVGMQVPVADTSKLTDGVIKFVSSDTSYATGSPVVTVNPVAGAKVTWHYGNTSAVYVTDKNGEIKIDAAQLTAGAHGVQIAKTNDAGLPLVLRFAPDYTITVTQSATTTTATAVLTAAVSSNAANPGTGEPASPIVAVVLPALGIVAFMTLKGRRFSYEK